MAERYDVTRAGEAFVAGAAIVAVALNALDGIEFSPALPEEKQGRSSSARPAVASR
jgi:hypothetical protein